MANLIFDTYSAARAADLAFADELAREYCPDI